MEVEDIKERLVSMESKQEKMAVVQEKILLTQSKILSRLEHLESQSLQHLQARIEPPSSLWQSQQWLDDNSYHSIYTQTSSICHMQPRTLQPPTAYTPMSSIIHMQPRTLQPPTAIHGDTDFTPECQPPTAVQSTTIHHGFSDIDYTPEPL